MVLADLGLVPIWVAIVFITRSSIVDSIRYAAISRRRDRFRQHPLPVGPPPRVGPLHARILRCPQSNHFWLGVLSPAASDPLTECLASLQRANALDHRLPGLCLRGDLFAPCAACDPRVSQRSSPVPAHETGWGVVTRLVIIDLDGTLLRGGSEIRFIGHLAATRRIGPSALQRKRRFHPALRSTVRSRCLEEEQGLSGRAFRQRGRRSGAELRFDSLLPLLRQSLLDRIARHRARADQVVLMTELPSFSPDRWRKRLALICALPRSAGRKTAAILLLPPFSIPSRGKSLILASEAAKRLGLSLANPSPMRIAATISNYFRGSEQRSLSRPTGNSPDMPACMAGKSSPIRRSGRSFGACLPGPESLNKPILKIFSAVKFRLDRRTIFAYVSPQTHPHVPLAHQWLCYDVRRPFGFDVAYWPRP